MQSSPNLATKKLDYIYISNLKVNLYQRWLHQTISSPVQPKLFWDSHCQIKQGKDNSIFPRTTGMHNLCSFCLVTGFELPPCLLWCTVVGRYTQHCMNVCVYLTQAIPKLWTNPIAATHGMNCKHKTEDVLCGMCFSIRTRTGMQIHKTWMFKLKAGNLIHFVQIRNSSWCLLSKKKSLNNSSEVRPKNIPEATLLSSKSN